jgi:hypothetical protein
MGLPRSAYVQDDQVGVYHCYSRCVRRAFLFGFDRVTKRNFSHRKAWVVDRLRYLAAIFAIEVCAYSVQATHHHTILRTRPDIAAGWSDREVAIRWLTLCPPHHDKTGVPIPPTEEEIQALTDQSERIAKLRRRLCSLSWFMGQLNEFIARAANKEDGVKGRFFESRFKCQALLDLAAIVAGMVYVDLNLIRAGVAETPEDSDFTSIQERIRAWQKERIAASGPDPVLAQDMQSVSPTQVPDQGTDFSAIIADSRSDDWLCPIQSDSERCGILAMTAAQYFDLVDRSGRMVRSGKRGAIDADLAPILVRIGARPDAWLDTVSHFGTNFRLAAGLVSSLRGFAQRLGRRWFQGVAAARTAFESPPPQLA